MQRSVTVVLTAAFAAAALVACAGGKQGSSTTTSTTTQSSPAASPAMSPKSTLGKPGATSPKPMTKMTPKSPTMGKPGAAGGAATVAMVQSGQKVFSTNCSSCHQANGKGQPGVFPPLAGNKTVTGPAATVIDIVKNGKTGKLVVNGTTYNGQMPAWKGTLSDKEIADVVTYIRNSWGNKASAVTTAQVSSAK